MAAYGLLIDYEYCTNCGSCQVSCKEEHGYPVGKTGIQVHVDGPWKIDEENWNFNNWPLVTDLCDLCVARTSKGREPACVHHCLANVITYGPIVELAEKMCEKSKQVLWFPQYKPLAAKGKFVPTKKSNSEGAGVKVEVEANENWSTAAHRRSDDDHFEMGLVE